MNTLAYGQKSILYSLERADRKTLAITVKPDLSVCVRAPHTAEDAAIDKILRKRAPWVLRQQRFFSQFLPRTTPRRYISGETHLYLGRQYRLRVRTHEIEEVKLIAGYISITLPEPTDTERVKLLLDGWYEAHARTWMKDRFNVLLASVSDWQNVMPPTLRLTRMTRQWGTFSPSGVLTLNFDLIRAPRVCIDYVILHELCHLRHPHHRQDFYRLLSAVLPDWKKRKQQLEIMLS